MQSGEETKINKLIVNVFDKFVAKDYSDEGISEFLKYVKPESLLKRSGNNFILIAETQGEIVGTIEIRNNNHISLLFVDKDFQKKGIGRELFRKALEICTINKPDLSEISVNSSVYAVPIYEKLDFKQNGAKQINKGIISIPMTLSEVAK